MAKNLNHASEIFQDDQPNQNIIKCHQLLLKIIHNDFESVIDIAQAIGIWGHETSNETVVKCLGLLIVRVGRRIFVDQQRFGHAKLCLEAARAIFKRCQTGSIFVLHTLVSELDLPGASPYELATGIRIMINTTIELYASDAPTQCLNIIDPPGNRVALVYSETRSSDHHENWQMEFKVLRTRVASFQTDPGEQELYQFSVKLLARNHERLYEHDRCMETIRRHLREGNIGEYDCAMRALYNFHTSQPIDDEMRSQRVSYQLACLTELGDMDEAQQVLRQHFPYMFQENLTMKTCRDIIEKNGPIVSMLGKSQVPHKLLEDLSMNLRLATQKLEEEQDQLATGAVHHCVLAQDWQTGIAVLRTLETWHAVFLELDHHVVPTKWTTPLQLALLLEHDENKVLSMKFFLKSYNLVERLLEQEPDADTRRRQRASIWSGEMFAGMIRLCLHFDQLSDQESQEGPQSYNLRGTSWTNQVILFLEQSRARNLVVALHDRIDQNSTGDQSLKDTILANYKTQLEKELAVLRRTTYDSEKDRIDNERLQKEISTKLSDMRATVSETSTTREEAALEAALNYCRPFPNINMSSMFAQIPTDSIVIYLLLSRQGLISLCMDSAQVLKINQAPITDIACQRKVLTYLSLMRLGLASPHAQEGLREIAEWVAEAVLVSLDPNFRKCTLEYRSNIQSTFHWQGRSPKVH